MLQCTPSPSPPRGNRRLDTPSNSKIRSALRLLKGHTDNARVNASGQRALGVPWPITAGARNLQGAQKTLWPSG